MSMMNALTLLDKRVFSTPLLAGAQSVNSITRAVRLGQLSESDLVFDSDGCSYLAGRIAGGVAPKWAVLRDPLCNADYGGVDNNDAGVDLADLELLDDDVEMPDEFPTEPANTLSVDTSLAANPSSRFGVDFDRAVSDSVTVIGDYNTREKSRVIGGAAHH
jgi:hypothetical protein